MTARATEKCFEAKSEHFHIGARNCCHSQQVPLNSATINNVYLKAAIMALQVGWMQLYVVVVWSFVSNAGVFYMPVNLVSGTSMIAEQPPWGLSGLAGCL